MCLGKSIHSPLLAFAICHCLLSPAPLGMACKVLSNPNQSVIPWSVIPTAVPVPSWSPNPARNHTLMTECDQLHPAWESPRAGDVVSRRAEMSWLQSSSSPCSAVTGAAKSIFWKMLSSSSGFQVIPVSLPMSLPQRSAGPKHQSSRKITSSPHLGASNKLSDEIPEKHLWKKLSCSLRGKNKGNPWT